MNSVAKFRPLRWDRLVRYCLFAVVVISLLAALPAGSVSARRLFALVTTKLDELTANGTASLGYSVSISGDWAVVGAPGTSSSAGAAYIYRLDPATSHWVQFTALANPSPSSNEKFGYSVAIYTDPVHPENSTAVVGARDETPANGMKFAGAVFVYRRGTTNSWGFAQRLQTNPVIAKGDRFGSAVVVFNDTLVVGAPYEDTDPGAPSRAGSAFIFTRDQNDQWVQTGKVTGQEQNDRFGTSVAINGSTLLVGAPNNTYNSGPTSVSKAGTAYYYERNLANGNWVLQGNLYASTPTSSENFGKSIAISGNTAVVGAPGLTNQAPSGAAYIYERVQGSNAWGTPKRLTGPALSLFGNSVAVDGDVVAVGAPNADVTSADQGTVSIFSRNQGGIDNWGVSGTQALDVAANNDLFGSALALQGRMLLVGAPGRGNRGAAYIYSFRFTLELDLNGATNEGFNSAATFSEDGGSVSIVDPNATITYNNVTMDSLTVTLANRPDGAAEVLSASPSGAITSDWIHYNNGVLTIASPNAGTKGLISDFDAVLRSVRYNNTSQNPSVADREVQFVAMDGSEISNQAVSIVSVVSAKDDLDQFTFYLEGLRPPVIATPYVVHFTLHSPAGAPTGSVTIAVMGTSASCTDDTLSSAGQPAGTSVGSCTLVIPSAGSYMLNAVYSGDDNFNPATQALSFYFDNLHTYLPFLNRP